MLIQLLLKFQYVVLPFLLPKCLMVNCAKNTPQSINYTSVCFYKGREEKLYPLLLSVM